MLFPLNQSLRYVGILPPLRTPHHPTASKFKDLKIGEFREGVIVSSSNKGSFVDIGVERPALLEGISLSVGKRVTVQLKSHCNRYQKVQIANRKQIKIYWGYSVSVPNLTLGRIIKGGAYDLILATSRYGKHLDKIDKEIRERLKKARRVLIAFGSPNKGLKEILENEKNKLEDVADFIINTIPQQGTKTVRTEEAVWTSLATLNMFV
jgi:hypothetical protein